MFTLKAETTQFRLFCPYATCIWYVRDIRATWVCGPNLICIQSFKGAMCNKVEYLLTEMQYDIHNYVFSGV